MELLERINSLLAAGKPVFVGIDGRSGAGKSTLARSVSRHVTDNGLAPAVELIEFENYIEGWGGLGDGPARVARTVLQPLRTHGRARPLRWDWIASSWAPGPELDGTGLVLLTGCGSTATPCRPHLDACVWVAAPAEERERRVWLREEGADSWWSTWARQEEELGMSDVGYRHPQPSPATWVLATHPRKMAEHGPKAPLRDATT